MKIGILFRLASFWVGVHYSPHNKRYCINLVPCITIWVTLGGGNTPSGPDYQPAPPQVCNACGGDGLVMIGLGDLGPCYRCSTPVLYCDCNQGRLPCTCKPSAQTQRDRLQYWSAT